MMEKSLPKDYYTMLLKNNFISDLTKTNNDNLQMEHSYSRDWRPLEGVQVMTTRTIMIHRPPQCPSCHIHSHDEGVDMNDSYNRPMPTYNEESAKVAMDECEKVASGNKNNNSDEAEWDTQINKLGWTQTQLRLFSRITRLLDLDNLARLANKERQHESVLRRVTIDKSVSRIRQALASVSWDPKITQWLHNLLMDHLPPIYLGIYLDILQTLKTKLPTLVDKMIFTRPISSNQEILAPVLKNSWEPVVVDKNRKLPGQSIIVIVPSSLSAPSKRQHKWISLFGTMTTVIPLHMNVTSSGLHKQSLENICEQMVSISRAKIQELRLEVENRQIILVGFNAGAALALQIALVEQVNSIVCMGFAFNTINGVRGAPDDRILDITTPILFILGQNAARSSQEEIESLREKMQAQTSLVVVGSADDALRVEKRKRQIEAVTQTMVDNMIMDEISEFASTCIVNPPGPREVPSMIPPVNNPPLTNGSSPVIPAVNRAVTSTQTNRKRNLSPSSEKGSGPTQSKIKPSKITAITPNGNRKSNTTTVHLPKKVGRPRNRPTPAATVTPKPKPGFPIPTTEALNIAIQSILPIDEIQSTREIDLIPIKMETTSTGVTSVLPSSTAIPNINTTNSITTTATIPKSLSEKKLEIRSIQVQQQPKTFIFNNNNFNNKTISPNTTITQNQTTKPIQKVKIVQPNQFVQLNPPGINTQKIYTLKPQPTRQPQQQQSQPQQKQQQQQQQYPIYTVKSATPNIVNTADSTLQQQLQQARQSKIITVKAAPSTIGSGTTQILSTSSLAAQNQKTIHSPQLILSPAKYTIMKSTTTSNVIPTNTNLKFPTNIQTISKQPIQPADLTNTNIFDIPILFADNDGNIQDTTNTPSLGGNNNNNNNTTTISTPIIISNSSNLPKFEFSPLTSTSAPPSLPSTPTLSSLSHLSTTSNRNIIINNLITNKQNKVVLINRNKSGNPNIISNITLPPPPPLKYTKVLMSSTSAGSSSATFSPLSTAFTTIKPTITTLVTPSSSSSSAAAAALSSFPAFKSNTIFRPITTTTITSFKPSVTNTSAALTIGSKIELLNNTIIKPAAPTGTTAATITPTNTIPNLVTTNTLNAMNTSKYQPIIINVDSDKNTIKNMIKVSDTQNKPTTTTPITTPNTIVIKSGGLRQIPVIKTNILNRNLTVRKVVNIVQQKSPGSSTITTTTTTITTTPTPTLTTTATISKIHTIDTKSIQNNN